MGRSDEREEGSEQESATAVFGDSTYQLLDKYADHAASHIRSSFLLFAPLAGLVAFHVLWLCGIGSLGRRRGHARGGDAGVGVRGPGEDGGCECVCVCVRGGGGEMERGEEGQLQLEETMEAKQDMAEKGHGGQERERGEARRGASVVVPSRACVRGARREEIRIWAVVSRRGRHRAPHSREARQAGREHQHTPIAFNFWDPPRRRVHERRAGGSWEKSGHEAAASRKR